jgi:hypothetical protein
MILRGAAGWPFPFFLFISSSPGLYIAHLYHRERRSRRERVFFFRTLYRTTNVVLTITDSKHYKLSGEIIGGGKSTYILKTTGFILFKELISIT